VADNGSSHRGQAAIGRLQRQWPTLRLVHLPDHASWLNQVEILSCTAGSNLDQLLARCDLPAAA
jgi:ABC-type sulfate transport system substrate-binding protein